VVEGLGPVDVVVSWPLVLMNRGQIVSGVAVS